MRINEIEVGRIYTSFATGMVVFATYKYVPWPGLEKSFLCQSQNCLRCHFSGRIFFHLGRNRAPRLKSLGAKKKKLFEAIFCTHPDTNIINEIPIPLPQHQHTFLSETSLTKSVLVLRERNWYYHDPARENLFIINEMIASSFFGQ